MERIAWPQQLEGAGIQAGGPSTANKSQAGTGEKRWTCSRRGQVHRVGGHRGSAARGLDIKEAAAGGSTTKLPNVPEGLRPSHRPHRPCRRAAGESRLPGLPPMNPACCATSSEFYAAAFQTLPTAGVQDRGGRRRKALLTATGVRATALRGNIALQANIALRANRPAQGQGRQGHHGGRDSRRAPGGRRFRHEELWPAAARTIPLGATRDSLGTSSRK